MNPNQEIEISTDIFYILYPLHRNKHPDKSQWLITIDEECDCFNEALNIQNRNSFSHSDCWGLYLKDGNPTYLGEAAINSPNAGNELFIAKFIDSSSNNKWHGYPADHVYKISDIPPTSWLNHWLQNELLDKRKIRKIAQGKKCRL